MKTSGTALRVLIADRSLDFQAVARTWLERHPRVEGVRCAATAGEAIDAASVGLVDLLLIDVRLGDMDGFEATRRIKRTAHPPLVVMMVLSDFAAVRQAAELAGADACIDKAAFFEDLSPVLSDFADRVGRAARVPNPSPPP